MKIAITIPAYNEQATIGSLIKNIKAAMDYTKHSYKILVVDDGSTDKTAEIARKAGAIVYSHTSNRGLAATYKTEMQKCLQEKSDIIVHIDADAQYSPKDIPKLIEPIIKDEADLVLGNRFSGGIEHMPLIKKLGNKAFSKVISKISKFKIEDAQTGFRAFKPELAKLNLISDFTYTQETIIRAIRQGFRVKEIPTYFSKRDGESRLFSNPFSYAAKAWLNLLRLYRDYEPIKFFGLIGGIFFSIGILIGFWFIYKHLTTGIKGHLGLMMLMILLILTGIQITIFGFLADMRRK